MKKFTVTPKNTFAKRILLGSHASTDHLFLGRLAESGQIIKVDFDLNSPHVIAIFGKRGSGKSYTIGSLVESLCVREAVSTISNTRKKHAALLFDTLGVYQWMDVPLSKETSKDLLKEQISSQKGWQINTESLEVQIWAPMGTISGVRNYNEFTVNSSDFNASDWGYLLGVDIFQDRMGQLLNDAYEKVSNEGWFDGKSTHSPNKKYTIKELIDCIQLDSELIAGYHSETRRAVVQQLSVFWRNPLFQPKIRQNSSQSGPTKSEEMLNRDEGTRLNDILKEGKLSIILLHKLSEELRFIIIISLIRKMMEARMATSELEKNLRILSGLTKEKETAIRKKILNGIPPTWIVTDETQNFLPSERKTSATDTLIRLVREGRNFGLSFVLASQQPSAVDQRILSQVDTLIVHKLTVQSDIDYVKRNIKTSLPQEIRYGNSVLTFDDLLRGLDIGQALVSNTEANRSYIVDIRPRVSVHGGFGT